MIIWDEHAAGYFVGKIGPATFEIMGGVGANLSVSLSYPGDSYGILHNEKDLGVRKRFCEVIARGYGWDKTK